MKAILVAGLLTAIASQAAMGQTAAPAPAPGQTATPPGTTAPAAPAAPARATRRSGTGCTCRRRSGTGCTCRRRSGTGCCRRSGTGSTCCRRSGTGSTVCRPERPGQHLPGAPRLHQGAASCTCRGSSVRGAGASRCSGCRPCAAIELGFGPGCPTETGNRGWIGPADRRAERSGGWRAPKLRNSRPPRGPARMRRRLPESRHRHQRRRRARRSSPC